MKNLNEMTIEELNNLKNLLDAEIRSRNGVKEKVKIELAFHRFKGSGKCWVAVIDEFGKKLSFVNAHSTNYIDKNRGTKVFFVEEGMRIETCQTGSRSQDERNRYVVKNGQLEKIN